MPSMGTTRRISVDTRPRRGALCRTRGWRLGALVLGLAWLAAAACGPDDAGSSGPVSPSPGSGELASAGAAGPTPGSGDSPVAVSLPGSGDIASPRVVHALSNPAWSVAPSLDEQILTSAVIVRATLQSVTAATTTATGGGHHAVQELRFTAHEYLKGSGPSTITVAVRDSDVYTSAAAATAAATAAVAGRVTTWDDREGVLFLRNPSTPSGAAAAGAAAPTLSFTQSNPNQSPWAYSVDTRSRAWLPAQQAGSGAAAATGTQTYITDGVRTPTPTVTLADLRTKITTMTSDLKAGEGVAGYAECVHGKILHERHRRAVPWTPFQEKATLASGAAAGTAVYKETNTYGEPQYHRYWLSGADAARFQTVIVDADNQPSTGYEHRLATARPLPAGVYRVHYNWQSYREVPCNFKPNDTYDDFTVTVTAPIGTLHEAFFDPVAIGTGVGAGGGQGALTSTSFSVGTTSTAFQRLVWDAKHIQLDLSAPVTLSSHALEVIGLNGKVALRLNFKQATSAPLPGGGQAWRWPACSAPWTTGDQLMLRLHPVASISAEASRTPSCGPAPTFGAKSYAFKVAENAAVGTTVGAVKATGQGKDAVTYALTAGNTGGAFAIDASTGALTVAKALDYETTASYTLTVQAEQPTSAAAAVPVTIAVTDVPETPTRPRR